ncbi:2-C-methyl-D-erythritol 4-phosphate cytidylyltransferase [Aquibacillus kalidii]|uniref:2-C-methyl-D-erythritol 4-phosphate cytidylyltransferase n=1 Tax=Aquibacillus kalidii TaxID=2762597 RepID=UPI001648CA6F|nr:2-C-methyl-D-erythritol 4-phosphate cytidylyltransferase [Aquibacillus kalidii]
MEYFAIVLAAGQGKRMKAGENKQFITLEGKPLIIHTLTNFMADDWCKEIILVTNPNELERMSELLHQYSLGDRVKLIQGGKERQESVYNGLLHIKSRDNIVLIHDGARPFVKKEQLHALAVAVKESHAALLAVRVTDTIKQQRGDALTTLDRSSLWAAQTPQGFQLGLILDAHVRALEESFLGTDDASLVERSGNPVQIVEGSYQNIKLTTPEDIERAKTFLND